MSTKRLFALVILLSVCMLSLPTITLAAPNETNVAQEDSFEPDRALVDSTTDTPSPTFEPVQQETPASNSNEETTEQSVPDFTSTEDAADTNSSSLAVQSTNKEAATHTATVTIGTAEMAPGQTTRIPISIQCANTNFLGVSMDLNYDPNVITINRALLGDTLASDPSTDPFQSDNGHGSYSLSWTSLNPFNATNSLLMFQIEVTLSETAGTSSNARITGSEHFGATDDHYEPVALTFQPGGVTVLAKTPINSADVSISSKARWSNGAGIPEVAISYQGKALAKGTDYTLTCKNNTTLGPASGTITGIGSFSGKIDFTYEVISSSGYSLCDLDKNGAISIKDQVLLHRIVAGTASASTEELLLGDANRDGKVDSVDLDVLSARIMD